MATKKSHKSLPTNRFVVSVSIPFPDDIQGIRLEHWFNLQNCGKETIPLTDKISAQHKKRAYALHRAREYTFVFEIDAEGEWKFIGRRE